jgi:hypothetical protein
VILVFKSTTRTRGEQGRRACCCQRWLSHEREPRTAGRALFEQYDRPALQPLPAERFVHADWLRARVNIDYHVEVDRHYYSVP